MSRLDNARPAVRPALHGRMLLSGPPGAGKTRSALIVASTLTDGPVLVIDTEKESALTYADDFTFDHLRWSAPFDPRDLSNTLIEAGQSYDVVIVDSLSHFWQAEGGTLDIADGKFGGWKTARPAQHDLVDGILGADAHVICCVRAKVKYEQTTEGGKHRVAKLGMNPIQDSDLEYEVNVSIALDMDHAATVAKSRTTALPVGRTFRPGHMADLAEEYGRWLQGGEPPADRKVVGALIERMNALPDEARKACKQEFVAALGRPEQIRDSQVSAAEALVASHEADS